jgi:hypothetical protein
VSNELILEFIFAKFARCNAAWPDGSKESLCPSEYERDKELADKWQDEISQKATL